MSKRAPPTCSLCHCRGHNKRQCTRGRAGGPYTNKFFNSPELLQHLCTFLPVTASTTKRRAKRFGVGALNSVKTGPDSTGLIGAAGFTEAAVSYMEAVAGSMADPCLTVRLDAIRSICKLDDGAVRSRLHAAILPALRGKCVKLLVPMLEDPDNNVRGMAMDELSCRLEPVHAYAPSTIAVDHLLRTLSGPPWDHHIPPYLSRVHALRLLQYARGDRKVVDSLLALIRDPKYMRGNNAQYVVQCAIATLSYIAGEGDPRVVQGLAQFITVKREADCVNQAAMALGQLAFRGDRTAVNALLRKLVDFVDPRMIFYTNRRVVEALGKLATPGDPEVITAIRRYRGRIEPECAAALQQLDIACPAL